MIQFIDSFIEPITSLLWINVLCFQENEKIRQSERKLAHSILFQNVRNINPIPKISS